MGDSDNDPLGQAQAAEEGKWSSPPESEYLSSAFPGIVGLATTNEIDQYDASNLASIAEEKNNGPTAPKTKMYRPRHFSMGSKEDLLRRAKSIYSSFTADDATDVYGFIQLDVLSDAPTNIFGTPSRDRDPLKREWKEIARWIKYEQDLEEGADRLGRPHIAPLCFHFIIKLNYIIEKSSIALLDLEESDMAGVAARIVEVLLVKGLVQPEEAPLLMNDLLLRHKLAPDRDKGGFVSKLASTTAESFTDEDGITSGSMERRQSTKPKSVLRRMSFQANRSGSLPKTGSEPDNEDSGTRSPRQTYFSTEDLRKRRDSIQVILQAAAEATMIMVRGEHRRRKGAFIFVRLSEGILLTDISQLQVPTRILVILLAPTGYEEDFVEMGRSFGTLMSNRRFYDAAISATGPKDLLTGINEFLHESIVLPPGDWYNHGNVYDLLPQHALEAKSEIIQRKKIKTAQKGLEQHGETFVELVPAELALESKKSEEILDPFVRTKRPFGGFFNDIKRRLPMYASDFTDGFSMQVLAATIFLYFASIAHNITFGGLLGEKTHGMIGVTETLGAACGSGILFALFSGQPLLPIAPTGPLLVFDEILYKFLERHDIEFLPARVWISMWVFIICLVVVGLEGSVLVKNFTRFTQETFSALISVIFVYESFTSLYQVYKDHPLNPIPKETVVLSEPDYGFEDEIPLRNVSTTAVRMMDQPNTALLSTFLMVFTFYIAYSLKMMRHSVLFGEKIRNFLGDFSVPIGILIMVSVDYAAGDVYTTKIKVPPGFQPTNMKERGWLISPFGMKKPFDPWVPLITIFPGILVFILMYMTLMICELIISQKDKLDKGCGFHFDPVLLAIINIGSGVFGAPWLSCATLKALAHLAALTVYSKNDPPGIPPSVVEIRQERLSGLAMSVLIGLSVLMAPLLQYVSMSVLFGVFLYMGITSLITTQFYERMLLFFIPTHQHPPVNYVRRVPTWKIHLFTLIQISTIGLLWTVKSIKQIALSFPFILMLLIPIRYNLKYIFTENELDALDGPAKPATAEKAALPEKTN